jgi:hypothetical protein
MTDKIHVFERAGLGKAPFRFTGSEYRVGPINLGNGLTSGAPGQPMGTCDYCGTGIADCCKIVSADGKRFIVGNVCVGKTNDRGLIDEVKREINRTKTARRKVAEATRIDAAVEAFGAHREIFEALPHARRFKNRETGDALTAADEVDWMLKNAGHAGKMRIARKIEKLLKEVV